MQNGAYLRLPSELANQEETYYLLWRLPKAMVVFTTKRALCKISRQSPGHF